MQHCFVSVLPAHLGPRAGAQQAATAERLAGSFCRPLASRSFCRERHRRLMLTLQSPQSSVGGRTRAAGLQRWPAAAWAWLERMPQPLASRSRHHSTRSRKCAAAPRRLSRRGPYSAKPWPDSSLPLLQQEQALHCSAAPAPGCLPAAAACLAAGKNVDKVTAGICVADIVCVCLHRRQHCLLCSFPDGVLPMS